MRADLRADTKLKLLHAASMLALGGVFICLLWAAFDVAQMEKQVAGVATAPEAPKPDEAALLELELEAEASTAEVDSLQSDIEALREALEAERKTSKMLREDLKTAVKEMREATGK